MRLSHYTWLRICVNNKIFKFKHRMNSTKFVSGFDMPEDFISLAVGAPGPKIRQKCTKLLDLATRERMASEATSNAELLKYGDPTGDALFKHELANFLTHNYGEPVDENNLISTAGASAGLFYLLNILFPQKCPVFCEELSYHIAINVFTNAIQCPLHAVEFDEHGIVPENLERQCESVFVNCDPQAKLNGCLYLVPTYHNPTGRVLGAARSESIVKIARKYKLLVLCDDVYNLLHYDSTPPPRRLFSFDSKSSPDYYGNVVSNGSFSKVLAPGIRLGWMEVPQWMKEKWITSPLLDSGGCLNMYMSGTVGTAMKLGLVQPFLDDIIHEYRERCNIACETLRYHMPDGCKFEHPKGGYFIWIELPAKIDSHQLLEKCKEKHKILFQPGSKFYVDPSGQNPRKYDNCIRIAISYHNPEVLNDCLIKICQLIKSELKIA